MEEKTVQVPEKHLKKMDVMMACHLDYSKALLRFQTEIQSISVRTQLDLEKIDRGEL